MRKMSVLLLFLTLISIISCQKREKERYVHANKNLGHTIDSLIENTTINENFISELFIDRGSEHRCDIILHIGAAPYYSDSILSLKYKSSQGKITKIYSGTESYFNSAGHSIKYIGSNKGIEANENHSLWIIRMYKDSIEEVFSTSYVNPFLLITSSPKYFINPFYTKEE